MASKFAQPKYKRYESRKIQGAALPQKERTGQVGQSPDNGKDYGKPHDGAVRMQAVLYARTVESP